MPFQYGIQIIETHIKSKASEARPMMYMNSIYELRETFEKITCKIAAGCNETKAGYMYTVIAYEYDSIEDRWNEINKYEQEAILRR